MTPRASHFFEWAQENYRSILPKDPTLDVAVAFIEGYDAATGYSLLRGFHDFLVMQLGTGSSLRWSALAKRVIAERPAETDRDDVGDLFGVVLDYLRIAEDPDQLRAMMARFGRPPGSATG